MLRPNYVLISTARVKCLMCRRLMGTFIGGASNIFRGKNHITKIVFSSIWGNFVLYGRALLLLFLLHCCWLLVNVSKYQVHQLITIALHIERSVWMLLCFPKLMSVFSRKIFLFSKYFQTICSDLTSCLNFYSKGPMFYVPVLSGNNL